MCGEYNGTLQGASPATRNGINNDNSSSDGGGVLPAAVPSP